MKAVSALFAIGLLGCLSDIGNAPVAGWRIAIALGLQALAGGLFLWACAATRRTRPEMAFSPSKPAVLFQTGPYRYVRHPFYSSYLMFWLSCTLATTSITVKVITALLIIIYTVAALQEQSAFLNSAFRPAYEAYQRTAGLFWPRLLPLNRMRGLRRRGGGSRGPRFGKAGFEFGDHRVGD